MTWTRFAVGIALMSVLIVTGTIIASATGDNYGRVCIQPIPQNGVWKGNGTGATERTVFTVTIDEWSPIAISTNGAGVVTNLSVATRHLVKIQMDGKPLTSFAFTFQDRSSHKRLWYNTMYGTWALSDVPKGRPCACATK